MKMSNTLSVAILMQHMPMTLSLQIMLDFQGTEQVLRYLCNYFSLLTSLETVYSIICFFIRNNFIDGTKYPSISTRSHLKGIQKMFLICYYERKVVILKKSVLVIF